MNKNYWGEMYGRRSRDFIDGVIAGVTALAVWKDGVEVIGIFGKPLKEEIEDIEKELGGG